MNKYKFLRIILLWFLLVVLTNGLAFADHHCTRQVVNSDGTKTVTTECSSSKTITSSSFWNRYLYSAILQRLEENIRMNMQNIRDQMARIFSAQEHSKQVMEDMKQKAQEAKDAQQMKQDQQETQLANLKAQQEMRKEQQQVLMQRLSNNK